MTVSYMKLVSGEEIICQVAADDGTTMRVIDPMAMETSVDTDDPTRRFVFMSRFAPYATDPVSIRHASVLFVTPASGLVEKYYRASLQYCESYMDNKFREGISEATDYTESTIARPSREVDDDDDDVAQMFVLAAMAPSSNSIN